MSFKTFVSTKYNETSITGSSFLALKEYMESSIDKFQRVVSGKVDFNSLALPIPIEENGVESTIVANINATDINRLVNSEIDEIDVVIDSIGNTTTITSDVITDIISEEVTQFQIQSEFLTACLSDKDTTSEQFINNVLNKFPNVSPALATQYGNLFSSGDKLGALKTWISQIKVNNVIQQDQRITLVNRSEYTGVSVWSVVIDDFVGVVSNFFEHVWQGIQDIKGFFERLWNGIVKLGKYIISKAFRYLGSNLDKSDSKIGILDYPILQLPLGTATLPPTLPENIPYPEGKRDVSICGFTPNSTFDALNRVNNKIINIDFIPSSRLTGPLPLQYLTLEIRSLMRFCLTSEVNDPSTGRKTGYVWKMCDVLWPLPETSSGHNIIDGFVIRMGVDGNNQLIISVHAQIKQSALDVYDDGTILEWIYITFRDFMLSLGRSTEFNFPCISIYTQGDTETENSKILDSTLLRDHIISPLASGEGGAGQPVDFASHFNISQTTDLTFTPLGTNLLSMDDGVMWFIYFGLIQFFCLFSPYAEYTSDPGSEVYYSNYPALAIVMKSNVSPYPVLFTSSFMDLIGNYHWADVPSMGWESRNQPMELPNDWLSCFKPYLSYNITPNSIHLQTITERAKEIEWTIIAAIIAAAAIAITVKVAKYKRNLNINSEIARGQCDNFAWTMDPTDPSQVTQYKQLRKKARKLERFQRMFGGVSNAASASLSSNLLDTISGVSTSNSDQVQIQLIRLIKGQ